MASDMTLYFDVIKQIQDQINRITYSNQFTETERLHQLNRLEHEITQKFQWARRSLDRPDFTIPPREAETETEADVA